MLLSRRLAVSAAHCLGKTVLASDESNCTGIDGVRSCQVLSSSGAEEGDLRLDLEKGKAYLISGVRDVTFSLARGGAGARAGVASVVVHSRSYLGGEYGRRGGFDLTLLMSEPGRPFNVGGGGDGRLYLPCLEKSELESVAAAHEDRRC